MFGRLFSSEISRTVRNAGCTNGGTTITGCHRTKTSCTMARRQKPHQSGQRGRRWTCGDTTATVSNPISTSIHHRGHATSSLTLPPPSFASSSSAAELPRASSETCEEQGASDASDSGMRGGYGAPDLRGPVSPIERSREERVHFRWRHF